MCLFQLSQGGICSLYIKFNWSSGPSLEYILTRSCGPYGPLASCPCMGLAGLGALQAQTNFPLKVGIFYPPPSAKNGTVDYLHIFSFVSPFPWLGLIWFGLVVVYGNTFHLPPWGAFCNGK